MLTAGQTETVASQLLEDIAYLKKQQAELKQQRTQVRKELKNASRRRMRLKLRAKLLSDADLIAVMQLRKAEQCTKPKQAAVRGSDKDASKAASASAEPTASSGSERADDVIGITEQDE